jgi:hypothetical protein
VIDLFKAFVDIALWRKGPQHLPASIVLLAIVAALDGVLTLIFTHGVDPAQKHLPLRILLEVVFSLGWIWLLLAVFRRPERFVQTATAIFGTSVLLTPLMFGMQGVLGNLADGSLLAVPMRLGLLTLYVWYLLINAHIVRSALEVNLFMAIILTVLGTICVYALATQVLALAMPAA